MTLDQFQKSSLSAPAMLNEWKSNRSERSSGTAELPLKLALRRFGATAILTNLAVAALIHRSHSNSDLLYQCLLFVSIAPPLVAGISIGLRNANRSILKAFKAHLILAFPAILLAVLPALASYELSVLQVLFIAAWWFGTSLLSGIVGLRAGKWLKSTDFPGKFAPATKTPQAPDQLF